MWWAFGFAVYGIARKAGDRSRRYKLRSTIEGLDA
jgi:hypothetical protein